MAKYRVMMQYEHRSTEEWEIEAGSAEEAKAIAESGPFDEPDGVERMGESEPELVNWEVLGQVRE